MGRLAPPRPVVYRPEFAPFRLNFDRGATRLQATRTPAGSRFPARLGGPAENGPYRRLFHLERNGLRPFFVLPPTVRELLKPLVMLQLLGGALADNRLAEGIGRPGGGF